MRSRVSISSHPVHPMLVAFPIGLWVTGLIFDIIGVSGDRAMFYSVGFYLAVAGCIGALLAAMAGVVDLFSSVPPRSSARKRGVTHGLLNVTVLGLFIFALAHRGSSLAAPDKT